MCAVSPRSALTPPEFAFFAFFARFPLLTVEPGKTSFPARDGEDAASVRMPHCPPGTPDRQFWDNREYGW